MTDHQISVSYDAENGAVTLTVFDLDDDTEGDSIVDQCKVGTELDSDELYGAWHDFCSTDEPTIYPSLAIDRHEPMIEGRRISVQDVVHIVARDEPWRIYNDWDLREKQVTQALRYYLANPDHVGRVPEVGDNKIREILENWG